MTVSVHSLFSRDFVHSIQSGKLLVNRWKSCYYRKMTEAIPKAVTSYIVVCEADCDQEWNIGVSSAEQIPNQAPCPACGRMLEVHNLYAMLRGPEFAALGANLEGQVGNVMVNYSGLQQCNNAREHRDNLGNFEGMIVPTGQTYCIQECRADVEATYGDGGPGNIYNSPFFANLMQHPEAFRKTYLNNK